MDKLTWGILSTARIGQEKIIPALQASQLNRVAAIASRTKITAQSAADACSIPSAYGSYEELLDDPEIDAVYIPLPNNMHLSYTVQALQAGKHVLCEKPLTLTEAEALEIEDEAAKHPQLKVMEAFMYRFHPQWEKVLQLISEGHIGSLKAVHTIFSFFNENPKNIRNRGDMGGGALLDVGCYAVSSARFLFGCEPERISAVMELDPAENIDLTTSAVMEFKGGTACFTSSIRAGRMNQVTVLGSEGALVLEQAFIPPAERPARIELIKGKRRKIIKVRRADQYILQADMFAKAILEDTPVPFLISDARNNMRVLDAVKGSALQGTAVNLE
ncbi:MAG: Gfo/Idh/MocA family oxidoreductase [Anaerolineales bacterium]|nr:Gfo/Idh/MocA family oxidoreductase [Anaerolineales bacterium]